MITELLNPMQIRLLILMCEGSTYREMVIRTGRSYASVRKDFEIIREKTQIKHPAQLALFSVARGYAENPYTKTNIKEVHQYAHHD